MGARSGDLDPSVLVYLAREETERRDAGGFWSIAVRIFDRDWWGRQHSSPRPDRYERRVRKGKTAENLVLVLIWLNLASF